jgi:SAM-dependent methyltransferase
MGSADPTGTTGSTDTTDTTDTTGPDRSGASRTGQLDAGAAELYERWFVPALFAQWPERLLDLAGVRAGHDVLDLGCGTGVLGRAAASRLDGTGSVTGLDPNAGMLDVAARSGADVAWRRGSAEAMPFPDASFDRVVAAFVLMFLRDVPRALAEVRRVTRPGGTVVLATWCAVAESPGYADMVALLRRELGDAAADALLVPFSVGTADGLRDLVSPGLPGVAVRRLRGTARFPSLEAWVDTDVRAWTLGGTVGEHDLARLKAAAPDALGAHVGRDGRVAFPAPALVAVADVRD